MAAAELVSADLRHEAPSITSTVALTKRLIF